MKEQLEDKLYDNLTSEIVGLCSARDPSLLQQKTISDLRQLTHTKLWCEWGDRAPMFRRFLSVCTTNPNHVSVVSNYTIVLHVLLRLHRRPFGVCGGETF